MIPNKFVVFINNQPLSFKPRLLNKPVWSIESDPDKITYFDFLDDAVALINQFPITTPFEIKKIQFCILDKADDS